MDIILFRNFQKRNNSTRRPSDSSGELRQIRLKDDTDILQPSFLLSGVDTSVNYVKWQGRYYHVSDITIDTQGMQVITCSVDVLASWNPYIRSTSAYVAYSSSDYDVNIKDSRYIPSEETETEAFTTDLTGSFFNRDGCFILGINTIERYGSNGNISYYAVNAGNLNAMVQVINTDSFITNMRSRTDNPMAPLVSVKWVPFSYHSFTEAAVLLSFYDLALQVGDNAAYGKPIVDNFKTFDTTITIAGTFNDSSNFTRLEPYSTHMLYLPFVGSVAFDLSAIYPATTAAVYIKAEVTTGNIIYAVSKNATMRYSSIFNGNCASTIPLAAGGVDLTQQISANIMMIGGAVGLVASAFATGGATLGLAAAGIGAVGTGISSSVNAAKLTTSINGSLSTRLGAELILAVVSSVIRKKATEEFNAPTRIAKIGLPCNKFVTINTLSGYVQTQGFSVQAPALERERASINQMLDSGIYLE